MKTVRLKDNIVAEVIPDYALPVEKWYGAAFSASCMEAPEEVDQRWVYNQETDTFSPPAETEATTPAQQREEAYNTEAIIYWDGAYITVTAAAQLWQYYAAEGNPKAYELQNLIAAAKTEIREKYPDT